MGHLITSTGTEEAIAMMKKRRNLYTILWACLLVAGGLCGAIPEIGSIISGICLIICGIFAGYGMLCINTIRYTQSGGRKQGGGIWWLILFIFGLIVMPLITVVITRKIKPLAEKIMGVELE